MKKFLVVIIGLFIIAVAGIFTLMSMDLNRMNADHYYVQINEKPVVTDSTSSNGKVYKDYNYTLKGYNDQGEEKTLEFFAMKELRQDAYLKVYVKDQDVSSYDEVALKDIPEKAQQQLKK